MKDQKIIYFRQQLKRSPIFGDAKIFQKRNEHWIDTQNGEHADSDFVKEISQSKKDFKYVKLKISSKIGFFLENYDLIVLTNLPQKTRKTTIERHIARLQEFLSAAKSSYDAHHDELTGVLNRHGIRSSIENAYQASSSGVTGPDEVDQQLSDKADITLFAFDIDRFKTVNDTLGHEAGDSVLQSFSFRLNSFIEVLRESYSATFVFGRPGGEEFELICVGAVSRKERLEIGDLLLYEIRKPMNYKNNPSTVGSSKNATTPSLSILPSQITASIGVAWTRDAEAVNANSILSKLRKEADTALYRAKADGRNCLRFYDDIHRHHGRVLEYHTHSELIQIDIGSKVGVKIGQVYSVYYSPFTGTEKVKKNESANKTYGDYPKIPSARIQVISVGLEVATATIVYQLAKAEVPVNSLLHYLPTGSKVFPHRRSLESIAVTSPLSDLYSYLDKAIEEGVSFSLSALSWKFGEDILVKKEKQTEFYTLLRFNLPIGSRIFYSSGSPNFVFIPNHEAESTKGLLELFSNLSEALATSGFTMASGIVHSQLLPDFVSTKGESIAFYASAALKSIEFKGPQSILFDANTPAKTIQKWRTERNFENALADYHHFKLYGFDSAALHNHLGLATIRAEANEYFSLGEAAFIRAINVGSPSKVYVANLAVIQTLRGKYKEAIENFKLAEKFINSKGGLYQLALAKCELEVNRIGDNISPEFLNSLIKALSPYSLPPAPPYDRLWIDIKSALKS